MSSARHFMPSVEVVMVAGAVANRGTFALRR